MSLRFKLWPEDSDYLSVLCQIHYQTTATSGDKLENRVRNVYNSNPDTSVVTSSLVKMVTSVTRPKDYHPSVLSCIVSPHFWCVYTPDPLRRSLFIVTSTLDGSHFRTVHCSPFPVPYTFPYRPSPFLTVSNSPSSVSLSSL